MNIALWAVAGLLSFLFAAAGLVKLARPKPALGTQNGMGWVKDHHAATVKAIGAFEVAAATGLVLPALLGIAPVLTAWAAAGLALLMAGAIAVHLRRGETRFIVVNAVLLCLAAFVAWGRFGPHSF
ncbi:DoxX-like protein [Micromonospora sp. Llam0]|uniref:DoxX family protein n=1 Tax=Micromonospora sp. Llam0 TaxID=2485143 RepID=UPI000F466D4A|nr:DoxX family protein [Micromonospora sp. Llam0]ROO63145.1 DoxX-like protein [Micromonospora sp. Llam0]